MYFIFLTFITIVNGHSVPLDRVRGWNYLNLHCRDNENRPVGWWYIYKPPSDIAPYLELGRNFTYITSRNAGRWQPSSKYITANSMLQHTLSPIYRPTYTDYLAVAVYEPRSTSEARGVLLADEVGGVWIGHTVPGLIHMRG
ncbi:deoxyribonuclease-2-alpha-like [Papilio machaon]|uniref:deoxyribonuclease-2-alpha-like n=1 Tax=Papilio machaon TaxID=76193 RepID=UPI001E665608|nr:deoxyribonuclease-2-alpha-like [Papilio machaon]